MGPADRAPATSGRASWIALGLLAIAAALVFWAFDALSFQDLPGHAGILAMRHRFAGSAFEQRYYEFDERVGPYSLFLFLGWCFDAFLGPLGAVRALATLPVLATPAVLLLARRRLHGDRTATAGFLGIAFSFGFMTLTGLASFTLALALVLLALTVWLELLIEVDRGRPTWRYEAIAGALAVVVFVAHGYAFVLFLMLTGLVTISAGNRIERAARWRCLLPAFGLAAWSAIHWGPPAGSVARAARPPLLHFQGLFDKLSLLATPTLITRTGLDVALGLVLWVVIVASFVRTLRTLPPARPGGALPAPQRPGPADASAAHSRALGVAAAVVAALFFLLPHEIGWFGFVDGRLVPLFLFLAILGTRRPALGPGLRRGLDLGAPLVAVAMTALQWVASYRFQSEAAGYHEVFAAVANDSRVLNLPVDPYCNSFTAHPFIHYDKLIAIDRTVVLSDVWSYPGSALYPTPDNPATRLPPTYVASNLTFVDWPAYRLDDWDYVLIRTRPGARPPATPPSLALAKHAGGWWLFRTARRGAPPKSGGG